MTLSDLAARVTGEYMVAKYTGDRGCPSPAKIARLAYEFYELHGRQDGRDLGDWLSAERQLTDHTGRAEA
jgi:hypothetical protein